MKFCKPHWDELKDAIEKRGLSHLIASSGEAAMERAVSEIEGTDTTANWDPLMQAHWMICGRALEMGGLYLLTGEYCPLCELNEQVEKQEGKCDPLPSRVWIDGCADAVLEEAIKKGLKPRKDEEVVE